MIVRNNIKLYHGSYTVIEHPDLKKCRREKDFGTGFYLTTDKRQAERFVKTSVRKAIRERIIPAHTQKGYVSEFEFSIGHEDRLKIHEFQGVDIEWLHCIAGYRKPELFKGKSRSWDGFDILAGKIANDNTNPTIIAYISGLYGDVGSEEAAAQAIRLLMPFRLKNQVCFRTEEALEHLRYTGNEEITWLIK